MFFEQTVPLVTAERLIARAERASSEREQIALDVATKQGLTWREVFESPEFVADVANEMVDRRWAEINYVTPEEVVAFRGGAEKA
jgi:hypothetical protein